MNNVDELVANTPLDLVLQHYGLPLSKSGSGEYRMNCVFNSACSNSQYGNLSIKLDAAKRIYCHSCETKGNLLTLLHGLETRTPPTGGHLRGQEFKAAVAKLREINGLADSPISPARNSRSETTNSPQRKNESAIAPQPNSSSHAGEPGNGQRTSTPESKELPSERGNKEKTIEVPVNIPLRRHEKEAARDLVNLYEELITDLAKMSPEAAAYARKRPWLTSDVMKKWGCGWIPGNGRSLFRKNYFVYTHRDIRNDVISYSGRDLTFEKKWEKWLCEGKPNGKKPNKHRYVAGFHRGVELYGGQAARLEEPYIKESLAKYGLVIVEGMNDVIRMDCLGVAAVGLCSNRATARQIEMLVKFAQQVANNRVLLLPDCDEEGETGFKEMLWQLAENGISARLGMTSEMHDRKYAGRQPESLTQDDLSVLLW